MSELKTAPAPAYLSNGHTAYPANAVAGWPEHNKAQFKILLYTGEQLEATIATELAHLDIEIAGLRSAAEADSESRAMFIARLENAKKNGEPWLTIDGVLALLNDCDYLASRAKTRAEIVECGALHCPLCGYVPKSG